MFVVAAATRGYPKEVVAKGVEMVLIVSTIVITVFLVVVIFVMPPRKKKALVDSSIEVAWELVDKKTISHDTRRFRFALPSPKHILGLPVGQHISFIYTDADGKLVTRPYTPTSSDADVGYVDFVIKVYFKNVHPKFPNGGKMSQHLESLNVGDKMIFSGPRGKITYVGNGAFHIALPKSKGGGYEKRRAKRVGMIAGGTGITPMLQIMRHMFRTSGDNTEVSLLFANQSVDDILLRDEIEADKSNNDQFKKLWYTVDRLPEDASSWKYDQGFISEDMLKKSMPPPGPDTQLLVCGPPPMIEYACKPAFAKLGYTDDMVLYW
ncbi:NADH-cytochrome b5 reductase 3 [Pycnococcus provasolii]|uniref:NADH-cytochrome b5 reductase n=1 Tax=Pycnococcus provasolii TaxID=41880 RepID=A0A830HGL8_9CHLO|nr:NADH-cytochrome b5 reductase 3 [Pycnococcus provasolii]